jgi:hypothetical protein
VGRGDRQPLVARLIRPPDDLDAFLRPCGRTLRGKQAYAEAACRKRMERRRRWPKPVVGPRGVLPAD